MEFQHKGPCKYSPRRRKENSVHPQRTGGDKKRKYEKGKISDLEYILNGEPMSLGTENLPVENVENATNASHKNLHLQNVNVEKVDVQRSSTKEIPYKKISYDEKSIYQSEREKKVFSISENLEYRTAYKNACIQISKNKLINENMYSKAELHEVADLIAWVNTTDKAALKIGGREVDIGYIRREFAQLDSWHISYVLDFMKSNSEKIKSHRGYLLTCLYNAPAKLRGV